MTTTPATPAAKIDEIREQQRKSWNKFAPGWKKWDLHFMNFFSPIGAAMLKSVQLAGSEQVLDVATGTGEPGLSAAAIVKNGKVTATDLSEEMVKVANENAKAKGLGNFEAKVADTAKLPFENAAFDALFCRFGIMFFPDPLAGATEMVRVLKPGARFAMTVWAPAPENPWASLIGKVVFDDLGIPTPAADAPGIYRFGEPNSAKNVMLKAGMGAVNEEVLQGTVDFESPEQYWELMTEVAAPIAGALAQADDTAKQRIRGKVLEGCAKFANGKKVTFPWKAYIVSGRK